MWLTEGEKWGYQLNQRGVFTDLRMVTLKSMKIRVSMENQFPEITFILRFYCVVTYAKRSCEIDHWPSSEDGLADISPTLLRFGTGTLPVPTDP